MSARIALSALVVSTLLLAGYLSPSGTAQVAAPAKEKPHKKTASPPVQKVYQVMDLITPFPASPAPVSATCPGCATCQSKGMPSLVTRYLAETHKECCTAGCPKMQTDTDEDILLHLIKTTIVPKQWSDAGGPCTAEYWPLTGSIVINAPPDVHEQITELLGKLRRNYDREVAVEVRFISIDEKLYKRLATETGMHFCDSPNVPLAYLGDEQVRRFMEVIQSHPQSSIMQAPKVTMFDGQTTNCCVSEDQFFVTDIKAHWDSNGICCLPINERVQLGLEMQLHTGLSADNRYVEVALDVKQTELDSPKVPLVPVLTKMSTDKATGERVWTIQSFPSNHENKFPSYAIDKDHDDHTVIFTQFLQAPKIAQHTLNHKLVLADGKSARLYGWKRSVEREHAVPILSQIPYIGQFYKHEVPGVETVLVMVTPRVILQEEQEQVAPPAVATASPAPSAHGDCEESEHAPNVDKLLEKYHKACAAGHLAAARKLAIKALTIDPTCFDKKR
jgi:hypothetical protein